MQRHVEPLSARPAGSTFDDAPADQAPRAREPRGRQVRRWLRELPAMGSVIGLSVAGLSLAGCVPRAPLDLSGERFLAFWFSLWLGTLALARWLQLWLPDQAPDHVSSSAEACELGVYDAAYLNGGAALAIAAALASAVDCGSLTVDGTQVRAARPLPTGRHELELAVYQAAARKTPPERIREACRRQLAHCRAELTDADLLRAENLGVWALVLAAPLLGIAEICLGLYQHRPVGILCFFWLASVLILPFFAAGEPSRTRAGRSALKRLRAQYDALRKGDEVPRLELHAEVSWAVALFGLEVMPHWSFGELSSEWAAAMMAQLGDRGAVEAGRGEEARSRGCWN